MKSMLSRTLACTVGAALVLAFCALAVTTFAQAPAAAPAVAAPAAPAAPAAAAATTEEAAPPAAAPVTFFKICTGGSTILMRCLNIFIWLMLFSTSAATLALIVDAVLTVRSQKIMPKELVTAVRASLNEGDLGAALEACEATPGPMANILTAGFNNVSEGYDVITDSVSSAAEIETEKLMQRVNFLNLCGAIGPMLGLMGTVTGMVDAFANLGSMTGAAKSQALAVNISMALYTTAVGLVISIPAVLGFTFVRNNANRIILTMETVTYDLIKVLRGAEVVDGGSEEA